MNLTFDSLEELRQFNKELSGGFDLETLPIELQGEWMPDENLSDNIAHLCQEVISNRLLAAQRGNVIETVKADPSYRILQAIQASIHPESKGTGSDVNGSALLSDVQGLIARAESHSTAMQTTLLRDRADAMAAMDAAGVPIDTCANRVRRLIQERK